MAAENRYKVDYAVDSLGNLEEVLQMVATLEGHVRIVSIIWEPAGKDYDGEAYPPRYTIISEMEV